jgi:ABC-2 type transport system ATP-binding protein
MDEVIKIRNLTKDFGQGRGVFDVNLSIKTGEVFGLVGINGSGKTTVMRHLMGFLHPDAGRTSIMGNNSWSSADELKKHVGYIPGEISFPEVKTGMDFFRLQADYMGLKSLAYCNELTQRLNLDPTAKLKRMSKGMKQKTAIVNAFMCDSEILLLDEATTGLDPLMQKSFTQIVKDEKKKGKTIFMSSHMFDEMESTCDRVAFLKDGHIIKVIDMKTILGNETIKEYKIEFNTQADYSEFLGRSFAIMQHRDEYQQVVITISDTDVNGLFGVLAGMDVRFISHKPYTLEACFKEVYNKTEVVLND